MRRFIYGLLIVLVSVAASATVPNSPYTITYTCTGGYGPFVFTYPISEPPALNVTLNGTLLSSTGGYTLTPINNNFNNGGNVTLGSSHPCTSGSLTLSRVTPITQAIKFYDNMPIPMSSMERGLDKLTEISQEIWGGTVRSLYIQNNGVQVDGPIKGLPGTLDFAGCAVTGTAATKFLITCNVNQAKINNIVFLDGFTNTTFDEAITSCGANPCTMMVTGGTYTATLPQVIANPLTIDCGGTGPSVIHTEASMDGSPFLTFTNNVYGAFTVKGCLLDMTSTPNSDATVWDGAQLSAMTNMQIMYPTSGAGTGRAIVRTHGVEMHATDVDIFGAYNCVSINGDNGQEDHWKRVGCYSPGSAGFKLARTTANDVGGQHIDDFKINNPFNRAGSAGFLFTCSAGSHCLNPIHMIASTADGMQGGPGLSATNWQSLYIQGANWLTAVNDPGVYLKDVTLPLFSGARIASGTGSDVQWDGQITAARFDHNEFDGSSTYAFSTGASWTGCSNSFFDNNHNGHGSGFASDADNTKLLGCGRSTNANSTSGAVFNICGNATNCAMSLVNPTTAAVNSLKYVTIDPSDGSMSFWNSTFTLRLWKLFENGANLTYDKLYFGNTTLAYLSYSSPTFTLAMGEPNSALNFSTSSHVGSFSSNGTSIFTYGGVSGVVNVLNGLQLSYVTGSTQCLHVNASGLISGIGADCGAGALPDQTGHAGQFLGTDGTIASWTVPPGGGNVVGPGSSTANNIAIFADGSGTLLANSSVSGVAFNGASQLLKLDASAHLPALDGSALTAVNATTVNGLAVPLSATVLGSNGSRQLVNNASSVVLPSGTLANNFMALGNGTNSIKTDTGCSTDAVGHLTCATYTGSGITAGYSNWGAGADNGVPGATYMGVQAPVTVTTPYRMTWPAAPPTGTQYYSCTDPGSHNLSCGWSTAGAGNVSTTTANTYSGGTGNLQNFSAVSVKFPEGTNATQNVCSGADICVQHVRGGMTTVASASNTDVSRGLALNGVCGPSGTIVESDVVILNNETYDLGNSSSQYCDITKGGTLTKTKLLLGGATILRQYANGNTNPAAVTIGGAVEVAGPGYITCNNASNGAQCEPMNNGNGAGDGNAISAAYVHDLTMNGQYDCMLITLPASSTNTLYTENVNCNTYFDGFTAGPTGANANVTLKWYLRNIRTVATTEAVNKDISCWKSSFAGSGDSAIYYLDGQQKCTLVDAIGTSLVNGLLIGANTTVYTTPDLTIDSALVTTGSYHDISVSAASATLYLADGAQWNTAKLTNSGTITPYHNIFGQAAIPTAGQPLKSTSSGGIVSAAASDVAALWASGSCGTSYMKGDGTCGAGGTGSPGGSDTQMQFNDASAFGGDADLTYNKTTHVHAMGASGILDLSAAPVLTGFKPPAGSLCSPTVSGNFCYDTSKLTPSWGNGSTTNHAMFATGATPTAGVCHFAGSTYACTGGLVTSSDVDTSVAVTGADINTSSVVTKVNAASIPASSLVVGTNSSSQFVAYSTAPNSTWMGAAGADPICDSTNDGGYTCTGVGTTKTYFANFITIPTASTAGKIDGVHNALRMVGQWDNSGGGITNTTYRLSACSAYSAQSCTGEVTLWSSTTTSIGNPISISCVIGVTATSTTTVTSCIPTGSSFITSNVAAVIASVPNSGSNWKLIWSVQFSIGSQVRATSQNMLAAEYAF